MWHILADRPQDSEGQWLYLLAIVALIVISTIAEKVKKLMADKEERQGKPSKPRPVEPPFRRPEIPHTPEGEQPSRRKAPAPNAPFPRAPGRPTARPKPAVRQAKPAAERPQEERWSVFREQPPPRETRRTEHPEPRPPALVSQSTSFADEARARTEEQVSWFRPLGQTEVTHVSESVAARSFRRLSVADLQRAIVLKEILEPPLALRSQDMEGGDRG